MEYLVFREQVQNYLKSSWDTANKRIAEHLSVYPDPQDLLLTFSASNSALEAVAEILALEYLLPGTRTRFQTFYQRERMAKLVSNHRREGHWKVVERLIQQPQGFYFYEQVLLEHFSPEDIFGNILPLIQRKISSMRPKSRYSEELRSKRRKVRKKVFRRGYDDKGCLRPCHKWLPSTYPDKPELEPKPQITFYTPRPYQWLDKRRYHSAVLEGRTTFERYASMIDYENHS